VRDFACNAAEPSGKYPIVAGPPSGRRLGAEKAAVRDSALESVVRDLAMESVIRD
jgi:hypothetical protein